jgi:uncharacterized membrane protein YfcA
MDTTALLSFLGLVALGSYIQTVSGFAIALIITGGATTLDLAPIAFTANVVSLVALANIATAVHRQHSHIDRGIMVPSSVGVLLFSGIGLLLLNHMSQNAVDLLEMLLGVLILGSGMLLTMHPLPLRQTSSATMHFTAGGLGGLFSGMFGAGGPPLVVHLYRQPLPFPVVRTTLLAILGIMPLVRLALEGAAGHVTLDILELGLLSVPVSIVATIAGRRFPPPISELAMRRFAFGLLCIIGLSLIIGNR